MNKKSDYFRLTDNQTVHIRRVSDYVEFEIREFDSKDPKSVSKQHHVTEIDRWLESNRNSILNTRILSLVSELMLSKVSLKKYITNKTKRTNVETRKEKPAIQPDSGGYLC